MIDVTASNFYTGDCRALLRELPAKSVQTCVTSPPYWQLRDYGVDGQIGLERTPEDFVAELVAVFAEVHRVLADDGTLWLNLGDSYSHGGCGSRDAERWPKQTRNKGARSERPKFTAEYPHAESGIAPVHGKKNTGLRPKELIGIPWMTAFALRAAGWFLRADIIWSKPNPMPESVQDRPTKSHEYIFLFAKSETYYYDADASREPTTGNAHPRGEGINPKAALDEPGSKQNSSFSAAVRVGVRRSRPSGNGFKRGAVEAS